MIGIAALALAVILVYEKGFEAHSLRQNLVIIPGLVLLAIGLVEGLLFRILLPKIWEKGYSLRTQITWFAGAWLGGIFLILATPIFFPVNRVERLINTLVNLNFAELFGKSLLPLIFVLAAGFILGVILFILSAALAIWQPGRPSANPARPRVAWILFALPMLFSWGVTLLAFWPAILSGDSVFQWTQVQTGRFTNDHPLLHTLTYWLLARIWNSPAFIAIVQILVLSGLVGWMLASLREYGLPAWAAWGGAILFSISPVNATMSVTLWKDFFYGAAILVFSFLILLFILNEAQGRPVKWLWLGLGLCAIPVGLYRHNGLPIPPVALILLALTYRRYWWQFARALLIFVVAWAVVDGPLMDLLHVDRQVPISSSTALHHVAAHVQANNPLTDEEKALKDRILPPENWGYYCYTVNKVANGKTENKQVLVEESSALNRMAVRLFIQNPTVDIQHTLCASSLVYRVAQPYGVYFYITGIDEQQGRIQYIIPNQLGLKEAPILPGLTGPYFQWVNWTKEDNRVWLFWRPALYLYLFVFVGLVLALRARSWKLLLFLTPGLIQSVLLFAVNIAQDFRYQYPVYLLGLFSLALLFLPAGRMDREAAAA